MSRANDRDNDARPYYEDPIELWISRFKRCARIIALTLMDEDPIISVGMKYPPNKIVTIPLYFERLEAETAIRRRVTQYRRTQRLAERTELMERLKLLCVTVLSTKR